MLLILFLLVLSLKIQAREVLPPEVENARCKSYVQLVSLKTNKLVNFIVTGTSYGDFYDSCEVLVRDLIDSSNYRTEIDIDKNNRVELNKEIERTCSRKPSSVCSW
jgi:hypothetical protein